MAPLRQPDLRPILGGYRLHVAYQYSWKITGVRYRLTVPQGGRPGTGAPWDGASTPRFLWFFLPPDGTHRCAALLHDLIYTTGGELEGLHEKLDTDDTAAGVWVAVRQPWTREQADRLFLRVAREGGLSRWKRRIAFRALRWFGGGAWQG